jgi:hypothetical protein
MNGLPLETRSIANPRACHRPEENDLKCLRIDTDVPNQYVL